MVYIQGTKGTNSSKRYKKGFKKTVSITNMGYILINYTSFGIRIYCEQYDMYCKFLRKFIFSSEVNFLLLYTLVKGLEKCLGIPKIARVSLDIGSKWLTEYVSKIPNQTWVRLRAFLALKAIQKSVKIDRFLVLFKYLVLCTFLTHLHGREV